MPQWYIAFWATVKIGAVLVTMNTAYKIHEAEYLLRQSDTHTLILIDGYREVSYVDIMKELCPELESSDARRPLKCKRLPFLRHIITVSSRPVSYTHLDVYKRQEFLSTCPTNWGMTPADALKWVDEKMIPYYPLGCLKAPEQEA